MAVVAMVEPEMAENTVPATTATTARRPGTCRINRSTPSITLRASPVWNRISPIRMNSGIGVSEKFITDTTLLRTTCEQARLAAEEQPGADDIDGDERERHRHADQQQHGRPARAAAPPSATTCSSHPVRCAQDRSPLTLRQPTPRPRVRPLGESRGGACGRRTRWRTAGRRPGSGASSHHSGITRVLMLTAPRGDSSRSATLPPYQTK